MIFKVLFNPNHSVILFAALETEVRGTEQQWLPQYLLILTGGSCSDKPVVQQQGLDNIQGFSWGSYSLKPVVFGSGLSSQPANPSCLLFISLVLTPAVNKWHLEAL